MKKKIALGCFLFGFAFVISGKAVLEAPAHGQAVVVSDGVTQVCTLDPKGLCQSLQTDTNHDDVGVFLP